MDRRRANLCSPPPFSLINGIPSRSSPRYVHLPKWASVLRARVCRFVRATWSRKDWCSRYAGWINWKLDPFEFHVRSFLREIASCKIDWTFEFGFLLDREWNFLSIDHLVFLIRNKQIHLLSNRSRIKDNLGFFLKMQNCVKRACRYLRIGIQNIFQRQEPLMNFIR